MKKTFFYLSDKITKRLGINVPANIFSLSDEGGVVCSMDKEDNFIVLVDVISSIINNHNFSLSGDEEVVLIEFRQRIEHFIK